MIPIIQGIFQFYSIFVISVFSDLFICFEFTFMVGTIDNLFKYFDQPVSVVLSLLVFTYISSYYKRLKIISFIQKFFYRKGTSLVSISFYSNYINRKQIIKSSNHFTFQFLVFLPIIKFFFIVIIFLLYFLRYQIFS